MEEDLCGLDRDPGAGIIRLLAGLQEKPDAMVKLAEKPHSTGALNMDRPLASSNLRRPFVSDSHYRCPNNSVANEDEI